MKFLFDHDVPDEFQHLLQAEGHCVVLLRSVLPPDAPDENVLRYARKNGLIVITCNRTDFISLAKGTPHRGVVLLFRRRTRMAEKAALLRLVRAAGEEGLNGNINFA